jgi:hypothetical protein
MCWTLRANGHEIEYGTVAGTNVASMLDSLRRSLPVADAMECACTLGDDALADGWRYVSETATIQVHRTTRGARTPMCPELCREHPW